MIRARANRQGGAVLLVALIVLSISMLLTFSSVKLTMSGMRMAVNDELRRDAQQNAQSLIDGALANALNLSLDENVGQSNCLPGDADADCVRHALVLPGGTPAASPQLNLRVRRLYPEFRSPPRSVDYSATQFNSASLQIESEYDESLSGWGRSSLREGVVIVVPMYGQ